MNAPNGRVANARVPDLFVSRRAAEELRQIWRVVAADNVAAADRLLLRIDAKLQILLRFPEMGAARDDIRRGLRVLIEGSYLLLYEHNVADGVIELITVVDGRRDLGRLF